VRDAQRTLAVLDAAYTRAIARLSRSSARRAEVMVEQDRLVEIAKGEVERTVATMAAEIGSDLTATLLGLDASAVRRLAKGRKPAGDVRRGTYRAAP
jgi:hypothetical protein